MELELLEDNKLKIITSDANEIIMLREWFGAAPDNGIQSVEVI